MKKLLLSELNLITYFISILVLPTQMLTIPLLLLTNRITISGDLSTGDIALFYTIVALCFLVVAILTYSAFSLCIERLSVCSGRISIHSIQVRIIDVIGFVLSCAIVILSNIILGSHIIYWTNGSIIPRFMLTAGTISDNVFVAFSLDVAFCLLVNLSVLVRLVRYILKTHHFPKLELSDPAKAPN